MSSQLNLGNKSYNPDVLSCLANLSNDEVFAPPQLANKVLDLLPEEIWTDSSATFLDPFTKTGVFLREITKRLLIGLKPEFPDLQDRINHILNHQVWGIAITELTALLSRRTLYCSKKASGKYSIDTLFNDPDGRIHYKAIEHTWDGKNCIYCGASKQQYDRSSALESYTYEFIHTFYPERIFKNMQFDVIVGNPPYQLSDGGGAGSSAVPLYHKFVQQAKRLKPRYLSMIIPARWYSGGRGLDDFRSEMLEDKHIRVLCDYQDSRDCFPGVDVAGGVCYFLWDRDNEGQCRVKTIHGSSHETSVRDLDEFDVFVRDNISVDIIHKVQSQMTASLSSVVSSRKPFGIESKTISKKGDLKLFSSRGDGKIDREKVTAGIPLILKWKVLLSKTSNDHAGQTDKDGKRRIFSRIEVMPPYSVCTESYLVVGSFDSEEEALNCAEYLKTTFVRFLVSTVLLTQNITKGKFEFVPLVDFHKEWTDSELFEQYKLSVSERSFIESRIRPMNGADNA